jgi:hypothetical protein
MSYLKDYKTKEFDEDSISDFIAECRYFDVYYNLPVKIQKKIDIETKEIKKRWEMERYNKDYVQPQEEQPDTHEDFGDRD